MRRLLAAAVVLAAACDAQVGSDYRGEPLATLRGHVESAGPLEGALEAAMLWQRGPPPDVGDVELATRAPVESGFPATFALRLYQPPPAAAMRTLAAGEVAFARANAAAIPKGIVATAVADLPAAAGASYGVDLDHWVVYLATDVPANSLTEWWLGAARMSAGFHLMRASAAQCPSAEELQACVADLVRRGVPDDGTRAAGTARFHCLQGYRLAPAADEEIVLRLGVSGADAGGACP